MLKTGIDNIAKLDALLKDARIGLMTNPTGVDRKGRPTIDILHEKYHLGALLACEHGVRGCVLAGDAVSSFTDPATGVVVHSCYGANRRLSKEALDSFDVYVYDIQDAGARFYTYIYSLANALEDCAREGKPAVVLDRPNPLGGLKVQGTLLDESLSSFVGRFAMPTRYALTVGEYALWIRDKLKLDLVLHVVPMSGWKREMRYQETRLRFVPPSPNLATLHALDIYPGTCIFEGTNLSEGRGTTLPFEMIGAPYIDALALEKRMNALRIKGVGFRAAYFIPSCSKHAGQQCGGVQIYLEDKDADVCLAGLMLLEVIHDMYPDAFAYLDYFDRLLGTTEYRAGKCGAKKLLARHREKIAAWQEKLRSYLLYR